MNNIAYHTIYLDTPDRDMYVTHQNGRIVREKIRIRTYINSDHFLEVKIEIIKEEQTRGESASGVLKVSKKTAGMHFYVNMHGMINHNFCLCLKTHFTVSHLLTIIKPNASQLIQELNSVAYKAEKYQV